MKTDLYNLKSEKIGEVDLPSRIFEREWSPDLVHFVFEAQRANAREKAAHVKDRGAVSGGGKKPWRQKGTGRARHGSRRSPIWAGGGVTHGPTQERHYNKKINKKQKEQALFAVLSKKLKDGEVRVVESLKMETAKTKEAIKILESFWGANQVSVVFVPTSDNVLLARVVRNIKKTIAINPKSLNVVDLLTHKYIILDNEAVQTIEQHYNQKGLKKTVTTPSTGADEVEEEVSTEEVKIGAVAV